MKSSRQLLQGRSHLAKLPYFDNICRSQFGCVVPVANRKPALVLGITLIICNCAKPQMVRVAAWWVIAFVQNTQWCWVSSYKYSPSNSMGLIVDVIEHYLPIVSITFWTLPFPAHIVWPVRQVCVELLNLGLCDARKWFNFVSGHVVLLNRSMCQVVGVGFQRLNASPILT